MLIVTIPWGPFIARVTLDTQETEQHVLVNMITVEPRFNEPPFNVVLDITNDILCPSQSYSKMYGIEPRYNEPRYNEFFDFANIIRKPKHKIYLDIMNYNVNTRQKINAEQINSHQIL